MPEDVIAKDKFSQLIFWAEWNSLELRWLSSSREATDDDVHASLDLFATEAVNRRPTTMIVDTTEFFYAWGEEMEKWRVAHLFPKYKASGAKKLAFIAGPDYPGQTSEDGVQPSPEGDLPFPTGWFRTRERAYEWLGS